MDLFKEIARAKVYDAAIKTTLDYAPKLSKKLNKNIFLKREDLQSVFSFKIRGAYNKIQSLFIEYVHIIRHTWHCLDKHCCLFHGAGISAIPYISNLSPWFHPGKMVDSIAVSLVCHFVNS